MVIIKGACKRQCHGIGKVPGFVDYKVMTYLAFFIDDERGGKKFEV